MSDLCMYEFEDVVWDEFDQTDNHMVPQPGNEERIGIAFQGDSCKKPRCEVIDVSSNAGDCCTTYVGQGKGGGFQSLEKTKDIMLEKDLWSHTPDGVSPASHDSNSSKHSDKEVAILASDNTKMSDDCFRSSNMNTTFDEFSADPITGDRRATFESNNYEYPLGDISQTDLSFLDNGCEDKESNDLLYYGWSDIGNFEDVDRMFGSCDSTFGLGSVGNEDELSWFSSPHTIEGSEDVLKLDFKFSCSHSSPFKTLPEQHEPSKLNNASFSVNESNMDSAPTSCKSTVEASEGGELNALGHLTFMDGSDAISDSKNEFKPKELISFQKKQVKHHNQLEVKRKDRCPENGVSFHPTGSRFGDTKLPSGDSSNQAFTSHDIQKKKKRMGLDSSGYLWNRIPNMHLDYIQIPVSSTPSGIGFGSNGLTSLSPKKDSSHALIQPQSMKRSFDHPFESPSTMLDDKKKKLQSQQGFHPSKTSKPEHVDLLVQTGSCHPTSAPKEVRHSQTEVENHSEVEGISIRIPADLDSSNVHESSCVSSGLDEFSLEASSFQQLQQVTEQLDTRTKLCIRDSLYRLARNAQQRHHYANLNGSGTNDRDAGGAFMTEGTNKCNGIVDMETDTNPIDRSIAHLLFHRPLDLSVLPAHDGLSLKSHSTIHGSITSPPMVVEKRVCQGELPVHVKTQPMTDDD